MEIGGTGTISGFVKQLGLKAAAESGDASGKPAAAGATGASGAVKRVETDKIPVGVQTPEEQDKPMSETERALKLLEEDEEKRTLRSIRFKMFSGGKLTASEKKHLRDNDPAAYAQLMAAESERKAYERRLRSCKTREEVRALNMNALGSCASAAKAASHGSAGDALGVKMRSDAIMSSTLRFMRTGGFSSLPTQAETVKANREMREAMLGQKRTFGESSEVRKVKRARMRAAYAAVMPSGEHEPVDLSTELPEIELELEI